MTDRLVVEGFAGPGGWPTGLAMLGLPVRTLGVEWDDAACKTAHAAGHPRVRADVARFDLTALAGLVWLLIMSPPCQAWSRSGKRRGILDQAAIFRHAARVTAAGEWIDYTDAGPLPVGSGDEGGTWHDARSPLVLEVLRWILATRPANIALEQVPDVLPFWELIARWLRPLGYNVWAGCLSSERYGVPQTRERAILIASRERAVSAPPATHTAYDARLGDGGKWHGTHDDLFGGGLEPWTSMAEALGWRDGMVGFPRLADTASNKCADVVTIDGVGYRARDFRHTGEPAQVVTEKARSWQVRSMGDVRAANGTVRDIDHPAGTITASLDNGNHRWTYVNGNQANAARRDLEEPAPTVMFAERSNKVDWTSPEGESVRVTVQEAAILQSFPRDYPWQGTKSAQFRQVGDAVPPLLAAHVLAACLGVQVENEQRRLREA